MGWVSCLEDQQERKDDTERLRTRAYMSLHQSTRLPRQRLPPASSSSEFAPCRICGQTVRRKHLLDHLQREHASQAALFKKRGQKVSLPVNMVKCRFCSSFVRYDRIEKHLRKAHRYPTF